jgi:hypothetical protein
MHLCDTGHKQWGWPRIFVGGTGLPPRPTAHQQVPCLRHTSPVRAFLRGISKIQCVSIKSAELCRLPAVILVALDGVVAKDRVGFDPLAGRVLAPTTRTIPSEKTARIGDEGKPPVSSSGPAACCLNFFTQQNWIPVSSITVLWQVRRSVAPLATSPASMRQRAPTPSTSGLLLCRPRKHSAYSARHLKTQPSLIDKIRPSIWTGSAAIWPQIYWEAGATPCPTVGGDGRMSNDTGNIILLERFRAPGTYTEALLEQSHRKEAASRSAKFLTYRWSANEYVICSKTTHGVLESLINPSTMEVIHYWASQRDRQRRLVKVG